MEKTIFKKGDKVFHIEYGWGLVNTISGNENHPIGVKFDSSYVFFTEIGKETLFSLQPTLSFTEYTFEGFSQERPIELPEVGEEVMVSFGGDKWTIGKFYEYKDGIFYTKDEDRTYLWHHLKRLR
jgi:hypothetical protein